MPPTTLLHFPSYMLCGLVACPMCFASSQTLQIIPPQPPVILLTHVPIYSAVARHINIAPRSGKFIRGVECDPLNLYQPA